MSFAVACDDGAGCDEVLTDLDGPISSGQFFDEAATARVSSAGVTFIEDNLAPIIQSFASSTCSEVWCPPGWGACNSGGECRSTDPSTAFLGVAVPGTTISDQSYPVNYIRVCQPNESPTFEDCNVYVDLTAVDINPNSTAADMGVSVDVTVWSSKIIAYIDYDFPFTSSTCHMYVRNASNPQQPVYKTITGEINFDAANPLGRLSIQPENIALTVTADDLHIENCILEYDWIKDLVWGFIDDSIKEQLDEVINSTLEGLLSESCADGPCSRPDLSYCAVDDLCHFSAAPYAAVPRLLGLEGTLALDALLGGFAGRSEAMDFSAFANSGTTPTGGLTLSMRAAAVAEQSDCVPVSSPPNPTLPAFSPAANGHHVAVGASDKLLNRIMHEAYSSGVLCQTMSGNDISALNSGAVSLLVPSLSGLTGGETVPLTIDILPRTPPELQIGANITQPDPDEPGVTELVEPLLTLVLNDLDLDLYAERQGALFRVLTLRVDLAVDLSLAIAGNGELALVAGDASRWLQDLEVLNAEVIAESPQDIEDAVPVLLGVVLPLLTDSLAQTFAIPTLAGFTLDLTQVTGAQTYGSTAYDKTRYAHLALYAGLEFDPNAQSLVAKAETTAAITDVELPELEALRAGERVKVRIAADVLGRPETAHPPVLWSRVDGGFWRPLVEGTVLTVMDPVLHIEGPHTVEVAAARGGEPRSLDDTPAALEVITDFQPPELDVVADAAGVLVTASDSVAGPAELVVTHSIDGLPRGELVLDGVGQARIEVDATQHLVEVRVRDQVGREAAAAIGQAPIVRGGAEDAAVAFDPEAPGRADQREGVVSAAGCSHAGQPAGGTAAWGLVALLGLLALPVRAARRRR